MLALVEAHEKTLAVSSQWILHALSLYSCVEKIFPLLRPVVFQIQDHFQKMLQPNFGPVGDLWPPGRAQKTGADDSSHGTKGALGL